MDTPAYRLRALRMQRAARSILDIAELTIPSGRITAIVGPNGAGKTTLLRILAFLVQPSSGAIEFHGGAVSYRDRELTGLRRQVTIVAQTPLLFHRSVRTNVAYGLRARRLAADGRIEAALAAVGLAGFAARSAWKLSGGEMQRVAIARALAIDPPVYLFDEPTANIDRQHVGVIESVLIQLGAAGKSVIFSTHSLEQAYRLGESIISMNDGRLAPFPLVNLLRGHCARAGEANYFHTETLRIEIPDDVRARSVAIDPEDIIISPAPLHSSARNCFPGHVMQVERDVRGVLVTIDCGCAFVARITRHSCEELALHVGTAVYVTFKSSAIHVLDDDRDPPHGS